MWVTDHTLEWVSDLRQKVGEAKSDTKHQARIDALISQGAAAAVKATATAQTQQPKDANAEEAAEKKRKVDADREKKAAKKTKKLADAGAVVLDAEAASSANAALGLDFNIQAETAKLEAKMGKKDASGKSPCYFHHTPGKKCKYEADQCKRYH